VPAPARDLIRALLSPRMLGLHVLAVVVIGATVLLGRWQLHAWEHGRQDKAASLTNTAAQPLDAVLGPDAAFPGNAVGQPVTLQGRWLPQSSLVVTGRPLHGRTGVWAVTPVEVCARRCDTQPAILVVRGWAPSRDAVPPAPRGPVRVTGWLQPGEGTGEADKNPADNVLPQLRIADAIQHVSQDLYGGYVIAKDVVSTSSTNGGGSTDDGLEKVTPSSLPKPPSSTNLRNLLYALEWWVFGGFFVFLWQRWCRDEVARVTEVPSEA